MLVLAQATKAGGGILATDDPVVSGAKQLLADLRQARDEDEEARERLHSEIDVAKAATENNSSVSQDTGYVKKEKKKLDFATLQKLGGFQSFFESDDYFKVTLL